MSTVVETSTARKARTVRPAHGTARWILALSPMGFGVLDINGTSYSVVKLPHGGYRLMKNDGTTYDLDTADAEYWQCSCPDYEFNRHQKDPRGCKHVCGLKAALAHLEKTIKLPAPKAAPSYRSAGDMAANAPEDFDAIMAGRSDAYPDGDPIDATPRDECCCGAPDCPVCGGDWPVDPDEVWGLADDDPLPPAA